MTNLNSSATSQPEVSVGPTVFPNRESRIRLEERGYHRIQSAATQLGCAADDLLHLGVHGGVDILAPVVVSGRYQWPISGEGFPEIDKPFVREFGPTDRVFLSRRDLAHMEALGWVIPRSFFAPVEARQVVDDHHITVAEALELQNQSRSRLLNAEVLSDIRARAMAEQLEQGADEDESQRAFEAMERMLSRPPDEFDADLVDLRQMVYDSAWHVVDAPRKHLEKTTIEHLFIPNDELRRLLEGGSRVSRKVTGIASDNGHTERHAAKREQVLQAAIYCQAQWPEQCSDGSKWAEVIDEKAPLFWESGVPPLGRAKIESLLRKAIKAPGHMLSKK